MKTDDDDDILASVNLDAWCVPPPRSALLSRVLSPAAPATRSRSRWLFAALALANVVLAAIVIIVISRRAPETIVKLQPAGGGGDLDAQTQASLRRLEQEQRALADKLADIEQLRIAVTQLAERVRQCEQTSNKTTPKPQPVVPPPANVGSCDEVSCVLTNFEGACCAKLRDHPRPATPPRALPETLDREAITVGIASIQRLIETCGQQFGTVKGHVKVRARVNASGGVEDVLIESTPDPGLGACVAGVVRKAIFEPTFHGGSFSYPFVFGASR
jgi:outer membrane biosynthesis protein TonB